MLVFLKLLNFLNFVFVFLKFVVWVVGVELKRGCNKYKKIILLKNVFFYKFYKFN